MRKTPILFTTTGHIAKLEEQKQLEEQRIKALEELNIAREQGDRSENGAYKAARWKLGGIDKRLRVLKDILRRARVTERRGSDFVEIGAEIDLNMNGVNHTFLIVGSEESDITGGKLSYLSPIGKAIAGKKKNDTCDVETPNGIMKVTIIDIR